MRYSLESRCGLGAGSLNVVHHVGHVPLESLRTAVTLDLAFRMTFGIHLRSQLREDWADKLARVLPR